MGAVFRLLFTLKMYLPYLHLFSQQHIFASELILQEWHASIEILMLLLDFYTDRKEHQLPTCVGRDEVAEEICRNNCGPHIPFPLEL